MHEQAVARNILKEAEKHGRATKIRVECGELAPVPAKDMEKALKAVAKCGIEVTEVPAVVSCSCGYTGSPKVELHSHDATIFFCRKCGSVPKVEKGKDIMLASVDVE